MADCLMPIVDRPKTKDGSRTGEPFTVNDPEYWKLEQDGGIRRHQHFAYPKMLYKAARKANGKVACMDTPPSPYKFKEPHEFEFAVKQADAFTASCQRIVATEAEARRAFEEGWRESPVEAIAHFEGLENDIAKAAAEAAYAASKMSSRAQAEYAAESASNPEHVTDVPKRGPGRPRKEPATE